MNPDIYNEQVASFQIRVNQLEKNIIDGTLKVETHNDFSDVWIKVHNLFQEYTSIYNGIANPSSRYNLISILQEENDFLISLATMMNCFEHYHRIAFVSNEEIKEEWQKVIKFFECRNEAQKYFKDYCEVQNLNERTVNNDNFYNQKLSTLNDVIQTKKNEMNEIMNHIEELGTTKTKITTNSYEKKLVQDSIEVLDYFYDKSDIQTKEDLEEYKNREKELDTKKRVEVTLDENYLNSLLSLTAKIEYVELVLANIRKVKGKKMTVKYKGIKERISKVKPCISSWIKCQAKLNELKMQYEEDLIGMTKKDSIEDQKLKEEYATLNEQLKTVERRLLSLAESAKPYISSNEVVAVASLNKEPLYVLKKSLNRFNEYFMEYKRLQKAKKDFIEKHKLEEVPLNKEFGEIEILEKEVYNQIYFLKEQAEKKESGEDASKIYTEIKKLKAKLTQITKGKKIAIYEVIRAALKNVSLEENIKKFYVEIIESPQKLMESDKYSEKEKKEIFQDILKKTKTFFENTKEKMAASVQENIGEVKEYSYKVKEEKQKKKTPKDIFGEKISNIKRFLNLFPKEEKNVSKIKNIKDFVSKKEFVTKVASVAGLCAVTVAMYSFASNPSEVEAHSKENAVKIENTTEVNDENASLLSKQVDNLNQQENTMAMDSQSSKNSSIYDLQEVFQESSPTKEILGSNREEIKQGIKQEFQNHQTQREKTEIREENTESEYVDFGDSFLDNGIVYENMDDAANQEIGKTTYFKDMKLNKVAGIVYNYNGENVTIYSNSPDAEAKRAALINNGAEQVAVLGINENASTNGWTGYFNDEEVKFVLDDGVNLEEGRGR